MKRYDGTTNPDEHLYVFLTQDNLYTNDDTILCRVFPMSLKEAASTRYEGLLPWSINSFDALVKHFSSQYAPSWSHRMAFVALTSLCQANDESLR